MLKGTKHLLCIWIQRKLENETLYKKRKKRKNSIKNKFYWWRVDLLTSSAVPLLFPIHERNIFFSMHCLWNFWCLDLLLLVIDLERGLPKCDMIFLHGALWKNREKKCVQLEHFWLAFYFHYKYYERVLAELLSTSGYRPRLNTVYLCFTSNQGQSLCPEGKTACLRFPLYKAVAPGSLFLSIKSSKASS